MSEGPMDERAIDERPMEEMVLDGNAVAGLLASVFGADVTVMPAKCAACGEINAMGALRAYVRAPGSVLRCPICGAVMLRIVETDAFIHIEARGVAYMRLPRTPTSGA